MNSSVTTNLPFDFDTSESEKSLEDWINAIKRRRLSITVTILLVSLISAIVAFKLPAIYQSSGTILIEQQEIPQDLVRSTVTSFAEQRLQVIMQRVMTSSNLLQVIDKFDLYPELLRDEPREVVVSKMRRDITLDMISAEVIDPRSGRTTQATIAFQVSYSSKSPTLAQKVANELTGLFLNENIRERTTKAKNTTLFLEREAQRLEEEIEGYEDELAKFKEGNVERLPELMTMNLNIMERTENDIRQIDERLRTLRERKIYLESQLVQLDPDQALYSIDGQRLMTGNDRLKALRIELAQLEGIYSENHPDISRIKREISSLEGAERSSQKSSREAKVELQLLKQQLEEARRRYSDDHPDVKSLQRSISALESTIEQDDQLESDFSTYADKSEISNPAYIQVLTQLEAVDSEIRSLQVTRSELQVKLAEIEQRLLESPQVEAEYRELVRDYETARAKYIDVTAKLNEARIGETLELGNQGEKFTIIEPPLYPEQPSSPNRPAILALGVFLSFAVAFGIVFIRESMDSFIYGRHAVLKLTGYMPIASIPRIHTKKERENARKTKFILLLLAVGGIIVVLSLIHFFHTPLDILYYKLLRKF